MASEEDRLDQLLKQAQQQMADIEQGKPKKTTKAAPKVAEEPEVTGIATEEIADPVSFDVPKTLQDEIFSESAPNPVKENDLLGEEYQPSTENFPMIIFDEIPEEIYRKTIMVDEPEEAVSEAALEAYPEAVAEPVSEMPPEDNGLQDLPEANAPVVNA